MEGGKVARNVTYNSFIPLGHRNFAIHFPLQTRKRRLQQIVDAKRHVLTFALLLILRIVLCFTIMKGTELHATFSDGVVDILFAFAFWAGQS